VAPSGVGVSPGPPMPTPWHRDSTGSDRERSRALRGAPVALGQLDTSAPPLLNREALRAIWETHPYRTATKANFNRLPRGDLKWDLVTIFRQSRTDPVGIRTDPVGMGRCWSKLVGMPAPVRLYRIPQSLFCDRTFLLSNRDAVYIEKMNTALFHKPLEDVKAGELPWVNSPSWTHPPVRPHARTEACNSHARGWSRKHRFLLTTEDYRIFAKQVKALEPWPGVEGGYKTVDNYLKLGWCCPVPPRWEGEFAAPDTASYPDPLALHYFSRCAGQHSSTAVQKKFLKILLLERSIRIGVGLYQDSCLQALRRGDPGSNQIASRCPSGSDPSRVEILSLERREARRRGEHARRDP